MPARSQYATASSLVSKRSVSCCFISPELVQPINGSTTRGCSGSKSSCHSLVWAVPDCIAFLAGLKMREVIDGQTPSLGIRRGARGEKGRDSIVTPFTNLGDSRASDVAFGGMV